MSCYTSAERSENAADVAEEEEYYKNLAKWMREQEMKREEEEQEKDSHYESYEPVYDVRNKVSRGTRAQRTRNVEKMNNFAQAILTGTIDQTKKNAKKYACQVFTDALPQHEKTLSKRREHRKREINLSRLSKTNANTANPSLSEQREMKEIDFEDECALWNKLYIEETMWVDNDNDRREHRYVGDIC
jgi:hypothetical protein